MVLKRAFSRNPISNSQQGISNRTSKDILHNLYRRTEGRYWSGSGSHLEIGYSLLAVGYSNNYMATLYESHLHNFLFFATGVERITTKAGFARNPIN